MAKKNSSSSESSGSEDSSDEEEEEDKKQTPKKTAGATKVQVIGFSSYFCSSLNFLTCHINEV